jgi:hypothetical protein
MFQAHQALSLRAVRRRLRKILMPTQPALRRSHAIGNRGQRVTRRVNFMTVGQCFDIEVTRELGGWLVEIPEIGAVTRTRHRVNVELAARKCIAARTGIPIGYVAIFVTSELG